LFSGLVLVNESASCNLCESNEKMPSIWKCRMDENYSHSIDLDWSWNQIEWYQSANSCVNSSLFCWILSWNWNLMMKWGNWVHFHSDQRASMNFNCVTQCHFSYIDDHKYQCKLRKWGQICMLIKETLCFIVIQPGSQANHGRKSRSRKQISANQVQALIQ
jgi:hypothetical protein